MSGRPAVLLVIFNRPAHVAAQIDRLRAMRPDTLVVAADGPRSGQSGDSERVSEARTLLDDIDWPCRIIREFSETNMGGNRRTLTGLASAFREADRVALLEDDIAAPPDFLDWAQEALDTVGNRSDFGMLCGYNSLGCWNASPDVEKGTLIPALRGSHWGMVTTRQAWDAVWTNRIQPSDVDPQIADLDPILAQHFGFLLEALRDGVPLSWDLAHSLKLLVSRRRAYVSNVNLLRNVGFGSDATRTKDPHALEARIPVHRPYRPVSAPAPSATPGNGAGYERAALLTELLARWHRPDLGYALSALTAKSADISLGRRERFHLAPFKTPKETISILDHFAGQGVDSAALSVLRAVFEQALEKVETT